MRKLPLIFLLLLLIALSACNRSPSPPTLTTQPAEQSTIPPERSNKPGQESSSQPVTESLPEPTAPPATESPAAPAEPEPTEPPTPSETAQPTEAPFDIDYWIGYAQSVTTEKGLVLEPSAVDCWDNPISANPDCIYLERDITARLNRYAGDADITDVWIWYECLGENRYLIYIGYA